MNSRTPSLWQRSPFWRWLFSAALLSTALVFIGMSRQGQGTHYTVPLAEFNQDKVTRSPHVKPIIHTTSNDPVSGDQSGQVAEPSRRSMPSGTIASSSTLPLGAKTLQENPSTVSGNRNESSSGTGQLATSSPVNKIFDGEITVAGQRIPLPPGRWKGLAFFRGPLNTAQGDSVVLGQIEQNMVTGIIAVNAYTHAVGNTGFPEFSGCNRTDYVHLSRQINNTFGLQRCWWINHGTNIWDQALFRAAKSVLSEQGASPPMVLVNVAFRRASANGFATTFYYFNPEAVGILSQATTWSESEWHKSRLSTDPKRVEYVKKLLNWGNSWASLYYASTVQE